MLTVMESYNCVNFSTLVILISISIGITNYERWSHNATLLRINYLKLLATRLHLAYLCPFLNALPFEYISLLSAFFVICYSVTATGNLSIQNKNIFCFSLSLNTTNTSWVLTSQHCSEWVKIVLTAFINNAYSHILSDYHKL